MSTVGSNHIFTPFVAGKSQPLPMNRLARIGYKTTKKEPARFASVCVSVPPIDTESLDVAMDRLQPYIIQYLESVQDRLIRSLYEASSGTLTHISDADISAESLIAYLDADSAGSRMTRESVEMWFDTSLRDNLTVAIAEKLGTENVDDTRVTQSVSGYRGMLASLSGGATIYARDKVERLLRALEFSATSEETDSIHNKLITRLNTMLRKDEKEITLEDL